MRLMNSSPNCSTSTGSTPIANKLSTTNCFSANSVITFVAGSGTPNFLHSDLHHLTNSTDLLDCCTIGTTGAIGFLDEEIDPLETLDICRGNGFGDAATTLRPCELCPTTEAHPLCFGLVYFICSASMSDKFVVFG
eukprot:NODE_788_length_4230_cov_0.560881.p4 type:complete len:136 gc:universal NODE_788_length_4230_cov_0.560881:3320-2913(-)